jgi:hypothetical protein
MNRSHHRPRSASPARARRRRPRPTPQDLLVAWCNVGKSQPAHITLLQECSSRHIDIIHVQEPATNYNTRTQNHPSYESFAPTRRWTCEAERPRVMTYIRKGAKLRAQPRRSHSRDTLWLDVNGITFLNFYREPTTAATLDYICQIEPPRNCVAGGDANANDAM